MTTATDPSFSHSMVRGVRLYQMRNVEDSVRGNLTVGEMGQDLPFRPERFFITYDIPGAQTRGAHAHHRCEQFVLCVHGRCSIALDDGANREVFRLGRPSTGLYVPPMIWLTEFNHTQDAALLIFASRPYEPEDYIRDYEVFRGLVTASKIPA